MTVGAQVKGCFSSIKSVEAALKILAAKTQEQQTKQVFLNTQQIITEIKDDLQMQVIELSKEEPQYK